MHGDEDVSCYIPLTRTFECRVSNSYRGIDLGGSPQG